VRKQLPIIVRYISQREDVELRFTSTAGDVYGQKDGEGDAAANQTSNNSHLQESQKQVSVQRVVIENITIRNAEEVAEPTKKSIR
jgi:hypothetical protein